MVTMMMNIYIEVLQALMLLLGCLKLSTTVLCAPTCALTQVDRTSVAVPTVMTQIP